MPALPRPGYPTCPTPRRAHSRWLWGRTIQGFFADVRVDCPSGQGLEFQNWQTPGERLSASCFVIQQSDQTEAPELAHRNHMPHRGSPEDER